MTKSQAQVIKHMSIKELYKIYRMQGLSASIAMNTARMQHDLAVGLLTDGSFIQHYNKHHGV